MHGISCQFLPGSTPTQACFSPAHCKQYLAHNLGSSRGRVSLNLWSGGRVHSDPTPPPPLGLVYHDKDGGCGEYCLVMLCDSYVSLTFILKSRNSIIFNQGSNFSRLTKTQHFSLNIQIFLIIFKVISKSPKKETLKRS